MKKLGLFLVAVILCWFACGGDTEPPIVRMHHPQDGDTVWATVYITAIATDNDSIDHVDFFFDDTLVSAHEIIFQDSFYQWMWATGLGPDSVSITIHSIAYDVNENNAESNRITVFVDNAGHPPGGD